MNYERKKKVFCLSRDSTRSQITIFILIAIVIVVVVALLLYPRLKFVVKPSEPGVYLDDCLKDNLQEALDKITKQGGSINPEPALLYQGEAIEYLCFTNEYYSTCKVQQPLLRKHIEEELKKYIEPLAMQCVNNMKSDMALRGYQVTGADNPSVYVNITRSNILVNLVLGASLKKGDERAIDKIELQYKSKLYDLIILASDIINWEATYGNSDSVTFMMTLPNINVEKIKNDEDGKVYVLTHLISKEKFTFASRSLTWYPGYPTGVMIRRF